MREKDYINATDLGKLFALEATLKSLDRPISISNVVYKEEYEEVLRLITYWKNRAHKLITKDKTEKWFFENQVKK